MSDPFGRALRCARYTVARWIGPSSVPPPSLPEDPRGWLPRAQMAGSRKDCLAIGPHAIELPRPARHLTHLREGQLRPRSRPRARNLYDPYRSPRKLFAETRIPKLPAKKLKSYP